MARMNFTRMQLQDWVKGHKQNILIGSMVGCAFLVGWLLPSPFGNIEKNDNLANIADTMELIETKLELADGSIYEGNISARTKLRQGYGRLTTKDGSVYEGNWQNDSLPYGTRTTPSSVYSGNFDRQLRNNGFGTISYTEDFIHRKRKQGVDEHMITQTYIGNWCANAKEGLGRSIKLDKSIDFGIYKNGILQNVDGMEYRVGGSVYGLDISHYQNEIDWDNLALYCNNKGNVYSGNPKQTTYMQPVMFVYIKATEGATVKDEAYTRHSQNAERHGIVKGAYHFLHLSADIDAQIKNFLETVTWNEGDLPPALDVEVDAQAEKYGKHQVQDLTFKWLSGVEKRLGVRPIIYTRERFRDKYLREDSRFAKYKCWISRYNDQGPDNKDWKIWQFTEKGSIRGYAKAIDINIYKDDYTAFQKYLNGLSRR